MLEVCCAVANLEGLWARTSGWAWNELEEWLFGLYLDAHARYPRTGHLLLPYPSNRHRSAAQKQEQRLSGVFLIRDTENTTWWSPDLFCQPLPGWQPLLIQPWSWGSNATDCTTIQLLLKQNYLYVCVLHILQFLKLPSSCSWRHRIRTGCSGLFWFCRRRYSPWTGRCDDDDPWVKF